MATTDPWITMTDRQARANGPHLNARMSSRGWSMRSWRHTKATPAATPAASGPSVCQAAGPNVPMSEQPHTMPAAMKLLRTNEGMSRWWSCGCSGMSSSRCHASAMLSSAMPPVTVKMLRQPSVSVRMPASTGPTAGATATAMAATPVASPRL